MIPRKVISTLREQDALKDLKRRLIAPVPDYSTRSLPDWRPSFPPKDDGD